MAKNYQQLQAEIDLLQKKAEALRKKELAGVVAELKGVIAQWGLTAEDLGLAGQVPSKVGAAKKATSKPSGKSAGKQTRGNGSVKYRDEDGNSWGGRGPRPAWLRAAIEAGRSLDEFLV